MRKNLTNVGTSLGFIIDKPIAELYRLDKNTVVDVTPNEDGLTIRFVREAPAKANTDDVMKAASSINQRYSTMMKNLAK